MRSSNVLYDAVSVESLPFIMLLVDKICYLLVQLPIWYFRIGPNTWRASKALLYHFCHEKTAFFLTTKYRHLIDKEKHTPPKLCFLVILPRVIWWSGKPVNSPWLAWFWPSIPDMLNSPQIVTWNNANWYLQAVYFRANI